MRPRSGPPRCRRCTLPLGRRSGTGRRAAPPACRWPRSACSSGRRPRASACSSSGCRPWPCSKSAIQPVITTLLAGAHGPHGRPCGIWVHTSPGTAGISGPASREVCRGASRFHPLAARRIDRRAVGLLEGLLERHAPLRKQHPDRLGLASGGPVVERRRPTTQGERAAAQAPEIAGEAQAEAKADGEPELVPEGVRYRAEWHSFYQHAVFWEKAAFFS
eukprot:scaffold94567_cov69-Phaeocystis_antarctica.AAC.2